MHETEAVRQSATIHTVGVADMKLVKDRGDQVVTTTLGSCIGLAIYDPTVAVGGILHLMLPASKVNPEKAATHPYMFADTGIPAFLRAASALGATLPQLEVAVVGGAHRMDTHDLFAIGKRNQEATRQLLMQNHLVIRKEHLGGTVPCALALEIGSGRTWITCAGQEIEL